MEVSFQGHKPWAGVHADRPSALFDRVNSGFMDMARELGGRYCGWAAGRLMPLIGFILGLVVVLAEPAVYVLTHQVEDMTGGCYF